MNLRQTTSKERRHRDHLIVVFGAAFFFTEIYQQAISQIIFKAEFCHFKN
tara:strand:- start:52 stop:201 length:150 start_codon:yes stop_codon:yes gene_type:complete